MTTVPKEQIHTRIWREVPEPDNPFATQTAYCHGYDVFGEMLGKARWVEMLYLLFRGEAPTESQSNLLEALAVALANPGPRDPSVHAAMCGGVAGSTAAASLMAALAVGAGRYGGSREVHDAMKTSILAGNNLRKWLQMTKAWKSQSLSIWPQAEHPAGFDPYGVSTATVVRQTLEICTTLGNFSHLNWLCKNRQKLEMSLGLPLAITGVASAALIDLGFNPKQGEMLFLLLRIPGAAAHALEQGDYGVKKFPFYPVELTNDPHNRRESA